MDIVLKYFSDFSDRQLKQLESLKNLYEHWNARINVISRKDMDHFYEHHILHCLAIAASIHFTDGTRIIDIGCGGGFPSVPLAIYFPQVQYLAVDSINKKLTVLQEVATAAGIQNITTRHARVEKIKDETFDFAVSRAVAPLKDLWQWSRPLISKQVHNDVTNGLICLKGGDLAQEIAESGTRPRIQPVYQLFPEAFFAEKYILHVTK